MRNKIPYRVICNAKMGDEDALKRILKHYEPLIVDATKRMIRTEQDKLVEIVDEEIRAFIESELVLAIINTYDPFRMPQDKPSEQQKLHHTGLPVNQEGLIFSHCHCLSERAS